MEDKFLLLFDLLFVKRLVLSVNNELLEKSKLWFVFCLFDGGGNKEENTFFLLRGFFDEDDTRYIIDDENNIEKAIKKASIIDLKVIITLKNEK